MYKNNLDYRVILKSEDLNIKIDNLDIDFYIYKTCKLLPDMAFLNIWNLDNATYNSILQSNSQISVYAKNRQMGETLLFSGHVDKCTVKRGANYAFKYKPDICTCFKLIDSADAYLNSYINIDYRDIVSSSRIILDCLDAMNLKISSLDILLNQREYNSYKAKGKPHIILKNICEDLNLHLFVQNGVVRTANGFDSGNLSNINRFNSSNASQPQIQGDAEVFFYSAFLPELRPSDVVRCTFDNISGFYFVSEISFDGNNYDKACITKITIGI